MEGWGDGWEGGGTTGGEVIEGEAEQNKVNKLLISGEFLDKKTKQTKKQKSPQGTREAGKHMPAGGGGGSN